MTVWRRFYKRSRLGRFLGRRVDAGLYHLTRLTIWFLGTVSLPRALAIADRVGDLCYALLFAARRRALDHLALACGDTLTGAERRDIARAAFRNSARCFVEVAKIDDIRPHLDTYASIEGWEHWEEVQALGRGGIVVTGHIGNWELLAAYVTRRGIPIAASARRLNDPRLNQLLTDFRTRNGMQVIERGSATASAEILAVLKQRGVLALLLDQDIRAPSVSVPFFGRLARTPVAAALLAVRRGIPVIPAFARRRPDGGHHFTVMAPIHPPQSGDLRRDVIELTTRFSRILEDRIRESPAEWYWWDRRWRRRPVPGLDFDAERRRPTRQPLARAPHDAARRAHAGDVAE